MKGACPLKEPSPVTDVLRFTGAVGLVAARTLLHLPRMERRELVRTLAHFGFGSLPLSLGVAALIGGTVIMQTRLYAERMGARSVLGWAGGYAALWEFGPLLIGLVLAARLGARNAAELATLQVGGQLEGLRGVGLDPFRVLVAPRVVGTTLCVLLLSTPVFLAAILCEALAASLTLGLPPAVFLTSLEHPLSGVDVLAGLLKAGAFGAAIALVSSAAGLSARGGARAVGAAAASAVVASSAAIFGLDFLLTGLLIGWSS
jgi:phospholipid/cholesterol/gamma-HCH transport system permease protein